MAFRIYQQQAGPGAVPGYRQNIDNPTLGAGERLAQGLGDAVRDIDKVYQAEKEKQRTAQLMEAEAQLNNAERDLRYNPDNGLVVTKGKNALELHNDFIKSYDDSAEQIAGGLKDEAVKHRFTQRAIQSRAAWGEAVNAHVAHEADQVRTDSFNALVDVKTSDAADAALEGDEERRVLNLDDVRNAAIVKAQQDGLDESGVRHAELQATTAVHTKVLTHLVSADRGTDAVSYLDKYGSQIDPEVRDKLAKVVIKSGNEDQARAIEQKYWDASGGNSQLFLAALEKDDTVNAKMQEMVLDRHDSRLRRQEAARVTDEAPRIEGLKRAYLEGRQIPRAELYEPLSDTGKNTYDLWVKAQERKHKGAAGAAEQNRIDRMVISRFEALDQTGAPGRDQVSVPISGNPLFDGASEAALNTIIKKQKNRSREVTNDKGVSRQDFKGEIARTALENRYKKGGATSSAFADYMMDEWETWRDDPKNDALKKPPPEVVQKWFANSTEKLVKDHAMGLFTTEKPAWQVQKEGLEGYAPKAGSSPAIAPQAPVQAGRVKVRKSDGTSGSVPSDKLQAFLAANPGATVVTK